MVWENFTASFQIIFIGNVTQSGIKVDKPRLSGRNKFKSWEKLSSARSVRLDFFFVFSSRHRWIISLKLFFPSHVFLTLQLQNIVWIIFISWLIWITYITYRLRSIYWHRCYIAKLWQISFKNSVVVIKHNGTYFYQYTNMNNWELFILTVEKFFFLCWQLLIKHCKIWHI